MLNIDQESLDFVKKFYKSKERDLQNKMNRKIIDYNVKIVVKFDQHFTELLTAVRQA